jgi:hypothetical protein
MTDSYKYLLRESPLEGIRQPTRRDPHEHLARIQAVLPIDPLPHVQQGGALPRSFSRDC